MRWKFPKIKMVRAQRVWLAEVVNAFEKNLPVSRKDLKIDLDREVGAGFDPTKIDSRLLQSDSVTPTLLGVWHVNPESELISLSDRILGYIRTRIMAHNFNNVDAQSAAKDLNANTDDVALCFELLRSVGSYIGGTIRNPGRSLGYDTVTVGDEYIVDAYLSFVDLTSSVNQKAEKASISNPSADEGAEFVTPSDSYKIINLVRPGASGKVYKVKNEDGEISALKCLDPQHVNHERNKRFTNEVRACLRIKHKNIIEIRDQGFKLINGKKCPFYVMPFYESTLRELISSKIQPDKVLALFAQIMDAVECAHLNGIVHRDLKPENILTDRKGEIVILCDFGIAHFSEDFLYTAVETRKSDRLANFQYAAPEQRERGASVDSKADLYSLGLILNEMFTSKVPSGTGFKTIGQVASEYLYLDELVEKMMMQEPKDRPRSIQEIKDYLIAKGNEFIIAQKLNILKNSIVPTSEVEHPLLINPPRLVEIDYENGELILVLKPKVDQDWFMVFQRVTVPTYPMGDGPETFRLNRVGTISKDTNHERAQRVVDLFKRYVEIANNDFRTMKVEQARRAEQIRREELQKRIHDEEIRVGLKKNVKI